MRYPMADINAEDNKYIKYAIPNEKTEVIKDKLNCVFKIIVKHNANRNTRIKIMREGK
jgi:hypothetical protein